MTRFLPKRRASTDQAPGPSIANPTPSIANSIWLQGSPVPHKAPHSPVIDAIPPAMGVHNPAARNSTAAASTSSFSSCVGWVDSIDPARPSWNKTTPAPSRRQRRPTPGQPFAKVENKRCNRTSPSQVKTSIRRFESLERVGRFTLSSDQSSMIPRCNPIVTAWVLSLAPSLSRMFLMRPLTVSSVIES
jgi:hypothetical protein